MHIDICNNAASDLHEIKRVDPRAVAAILAVLEQIEADPNAIDKLTTRGDNSFGNSLLNVKLWESMKRKGNIWRFRALDTPATSYRIVYGYHWQTRQICVLAIVHRENIDYDNPESDLGQRITTDWRSI